jgi:ankyrin repeat protein
VHKAVWRSDAGVVGHLLAAGADLEACNDNGETSILTYARNISEHCLNNFHNTGEGANTRLEVFKLLLDAGADVGAKDGEGRSVLHALNSRPALGYMAVGKIEAARMLLERGAEVNVKDVEGRTALMVLNRGFEPDLARFLIDSGAEE